MSSTIDLDQKIIILSEAVFTQFTYRIAFLWSFAIVISPGSSQLLVGNTSIPLESPQWKAGIAKAKITPPDPVVLGGFASRREPFSGVIQDLYVKALALEDKVGHQSLLITCDFLGFRANTADPIRNRIMEITGLDESQIIINSSHTHTGPGQAARPDAPSYLKPEYVRALNEYTVWLQNRVVESAVSALEELHPVNLGFDTGYAPFVMNRREPSERGITLGHNPRGPADQSVPVLKVEHQKGELFAVVFGAACHNTTIPPSDNRVSGDFAGYAQEFIEKKYPGTQAMFMQGLGGDSGPYPTGSIEYSKKHGKTLGGEVCRILRENQFTPVNGSLRTVSQRIPLPLAEAFSSEKIEEYRAAPAQWKKWVGKMMLLRMQSGQPFRTTYEAPFGIWQFGEDLTMVAMSGEVVVDYVYLIEEAIGPLNLWISGYNNDVFGYLPSARVLQEEGYETRGLYSGEMFAPEVEKVVIKAIRNLAKRARRPIP